MFVGRRPCSLNVSRSSLVKAEPLLKYGVRRSAFPYVKSAVWVLGIMEGGKRAVRVVRCAPEVDRGRWANLFSFPCFELDAMAALRCRAMRDLRGVQSRPRDAALVRPAFTKR
jgi:hypothetical protein